MDDILCNQLFNMLAHRTNTCVPSASPRKIVRVIRNKTRVTASEFMLSVIRVCYMINGVHVQGSCFITFFYGPFHLIKYRYHIQNENTGITELWEKESKIWKSL